jgi:hypothetical protein
MSDHVHVNNNFQAINVRVHFWGHQLWIIMRISWAMFGPTLHVRCVVIVWGRDLAVQWMVFGLLSLKVLRDETGSNHAWSVRNTQIIPIPAHILKIFLYVQCGRGALNHIFLPNIGIGAFALSALAYLVYDNLFICGAICRMSQRFLGANQEWNEQTWSWDSGHFHSRPSVLHGRAARPFGPLSHFTYILRQDNDGKLLKKGLRHIILN